MASTFGQLTDYFGVTTHATNGQRLMLVASNSGTSRRVTNLWNGAFEQGAELANPACTYRIKSAGIVTFTFGKSWNDANGKYMLTDVEYKTGADAEPLLVLKGCANEGADAINKHTVNFNVTPDHVAHDTYGAISGGGELVECTTTFSCDPVVPYEDNHPCASDIVHGRRTVSATTAAYDGEAAPTAVSPFVSFGTPKAERDVDFTTYTITAEVRLT